MIANNNPNSNGQDDLRDIDRNYEDTTGSNYAGNDREDKNGLDEDDRLDKEDDVYKDDDLDKEDESGASRHVTGSYPGEKQDNRPDEIPEKHESENEPSGYPHETEFHQPEKSSDASYSEQIDVTPPNPHEFPSVGNAKTDFVSRPYPRSTGRMVGHEPGTEGI